MSFPKEFHQSVIDHVTVGVYYIQLLASYTTHQSHRHKRQGDQWKQRHSGHHLL